MIKTDLTTSEIEELKNLKQNQPVFAGNVISKHSSQSLIDKGYAMRYEGEYCLTEKGNEEWKKLAAFEVMASGIMYKPNGCTAKSGRHYMGCENCGKGNHLTCLTEGKEQNTNDK